MNMSPVKCDAVLCEQGRVFGTIVEVMILYTNIRVFEREFIQILDCWLTGSTMGIVKELDGERRTKQIPDAGVCHHLIELFSGNF